MENHRHTQQLIQHKLTSKPQAEFALLSFPMPWQGPSVNKKTERENAS